MVSPRGLMRAGGARQLRLLGKKCTIPLRDPVNKSGGVDLELPNLRTEDLKFSNVE